MAALLLLIIYIAFISLGLPDAIFGVAWPQMQIDLSLGLELGGYPALITTFGTVLSSLLSGYIIAKLKTGRVIVFSVFLTAFALLGISQSNSFIVILIFAFPLGFGAGSIDTALNNYVALNYKPHHMNWLHSFWGVGATLGPLIMSHYLLELDWHKGYFVIALIQITFLIILCFSLPLWKKNADNGHHKEETKVKPNIFKIKGVIYALLIFLVYCAIEFSIGLWGPSYLVINKGISVAKAAQYIMLYYLGITGGRFISGLLTFKFKNRQLIFGGVAVVFIGGLLLLLSKSNILVLASLIIIGMGLAPIFPSMIHDTPVNFGKENSQYVVGYQIAFAYIGFAIFPPVFGYIFSIINISLFPIFIFILSFILLLLLITLVIKISHKDNNAI
jgi:fucose permease